jgi:hypothetical protein
MIEQIDPMLPHMENYVRNLRDYGAVPGTVPEADGAFPIPMIIEQTVTIPL